MVIVGLNNGLTTFNKPLRDGGVCAIVDNKIKMIVAEERITRIKRAGGYEKSLAHLLRKLDLSLKDIDVIAFSSCCEPLLLNFNIRKTKNNIKYIPVNHHLSHAYSVHFASGFDESLTVVIDAGGNTLDGKTNPDWWTAPREQHSYYICNGHSVNKIDEDFQDPYSAGIGEIYRAFTYYLGWHSSQYSNKTMALAAYGDPSRFFGKSIFKTESDGALTSNVINNPKDPKKMVDQILKDNGVAGFNSRAVNGPLLQMHKDLAYWIQSETEKAIINKIEYLINKTKIKNICFAGGVAYNCRLNGSLIMNLPIDSFYIHPGSGDNGQCLGNAISASLSMNKIVDIFPFDPYLGTSETITLDKIRNIIGTKAQVSFLQSDNYIKECAELLAAGNLICWFQGRSEYGPRALGNRSILGDPRDEEQKMKLNKIKGRETFLPFAPSVLADNAFKYFDVKVKSPYMTYAFKTNANMKKYIPAAIHIDGSSRVQVVEENTNPIFYKLISAFNNITDIPMVINTSFNKAKEPIVETLEDAIDSFLNLDINYMCAGSVIFKKKGTIPVLTVENTSHNIIFCNSEISIDKLENNLKSLFPNHLLYPRDKLGLYTVYFNWLENGKKTTTIRYRKHGIDYPKSTHMDIIEKQDFSNNLDGKCTAQISITELAVKKYGDLSDTDAKLDGFNCLEDLKKALVEIYGVINSEELVSIYHIKLVHS